jgi:hypothetical protein
MIFDFSMMLSALQYGYYLAGALFLYYNRVDLLYRDGDLSLGRVWAWIMFLIAVIFWFRFATGQIPPETPFPPMLDNLLYACLMYEFGKKSAFSVRSIMSQQNQRKHRISKMGMYEENAPRLEQGG